jgi:outer membrane receptor protein involved in Fe transport
VGGSAFRLEGANGGFGWRAGLTGRISGALSTPLGELENTNFMSLNGEGAVGTQGAWGKAQLRVIHYGGEFHLLEADTAGAPPPPPTGGADQGPVRKLSDDRVQATTMLPLGGLRLEVKTQWQRHSLVEVTEGDTSSKDRGFDLLLNTGTVDVLAHHGSGALRGTVGLSGLVQRNDTRGAEPLVPGVTTTGAAAFAFEEATLGRVSLLAGLRGDARYLAADSNADLALGNQTRSYTAWTGDVGLVFRPADRLAVSANVGRAWRAPTLFELFANGLEIGEARFEVGDRTLVPEAGIDADVSLRWEGERVRGQVAAYHNRIDHYIYIAPTGATQDSFPVFQYRQANAALWGGELELATEPWPTLTLSARGDYVRGTQSDGTPLPLMPPLRGRLEAEWHKVALSWADRLAVGAAVEMVGRQTRLAPYDIPTGSYTLLDVSGSLSRRFGALPLRFDLQVRNVADTKYRDFLSRYKAFALNPGRNIIVRCSTTF